MTRTIVAIDDDIKIWIDIKAVREGVPMTEVGGDAAIYLDPTDPPGAAAVIANSLTRFPQLRQAGLENVKRFTPAAMISSYSRLYRQLAA